MKRALPLLALLFAVGIGQGRAATIAATGGGDWYSTAPNAPWPGGTVPQSTDDAIISASVTVNSPVIIHNLTITNGGTFFNNNTLTITGDLTLTNTITVQGGPTSISIDGNLNIASNTTFNASQAAVAVAGVTMIYGTLKDADGVQGTNELAAVSVQPGGTWALNNVTEWSVSGDLTNDGAITATVGGITFSGESNTIAGVNGFAIPAMNVVGNYENDVPVTNAISLAGSGSLTVGANSSLTLGGTITIASLTATAVPNTVSYNRAGAQTVLPASYYDLFLTGSNIKTVSGSVNVADNLEVASVAQAMVNGTVNVTGMAKVDPSAFLLGTGALNGPMVVNGTLSPGGPLGTLTLNTAPNLFGAVLVEINRTNSPNASELAVSGNPVSYGGSLTVANLGGTLLAGDTFQLFSATGYESSFDTIDLPMLTTNLYWTNLLASNGTIAVVSAVSTGGSTNMPTLAEVPGGNMITLSWDTNDFPGYCVQSETNLDDGNWSDETNGSVSPVMISINPTAQSTFFQLFHP